MTVFAYTFIEACAVVDVGLRALSIKRAASMRPWFAWAAPLPRVVGERWEPRFCAIEIEHPWKISSVTTRIDKHVHIRIVAAHSAVAL